MPSATIGRAGADFLEGRALDLELALRLGVYTCRHDRIKRAMVPADNGDVLAFPFLEDGRVVACKYRSIGGKKFWQEPGRKQTFYNRDVMLDPGVQNGHYPLIVTEGELDCLAALSAGFPHTVSVPDGAPGPRGADVQAQDDKAPETPRFKFVWNNRDIVSRIKRFILAVDNDEPGQRLAEELTRRFSAVRCYKVEYPKGCKDLNDVLIGYGAEGVARVINTATPYPVQGIYRLSDYPDRKLVTFDCGWRTLDDHFRLFHGQFVVITGVPSHGKSTFALRLLVNIARRHRWRSAIYSPEMPVVPHLRDTVRKMFATSGTAEHLSNEIADCFIEDYFTFIDHDPTGADGDNISVDTIIDRTRDAVLRDDIRVLLVDPWNEIEHSKPPGEPISDYVGRCIRDLRRLAINHGLTVIVVAHPTKDVKTPKGTTRPPTLYDVENSAHWFNKADHGIVVWRPNDDAEAKVDLAWKSDCEIIVTKARFPQSGVRGIVKFKFNKQTLDFEPLDGSNNAPDDPALKL